MIENNIANLFIHIGNLWREHWLHLHGLDILPNLLVKDDDSFSGYRCPSFFIHVTVAKRTPCPFETKPEHMAFLSNHHEGMVAFIPELKWHKGRHITMKIGKYLQKYFPDKYDNEEIKRIVARCQSFTLEFRDDIIDAYREAHHDCSACESCMSEDTDHYSSEYHPMSVFENNSGFQAVLMRNQCGQIVSRALVDTINKRFPMIYGHAHLRKMLEDEGYRVGTFEGRVLDVDWHYEGESIQLPYIDGDRIIGDRSYHASMGFDFNSEDMTITLCENGEYSASETCGYVQVRTIIASCTNCGDHLYEGDDYSYDNYDEIICECCRTHDYVSAMDNYGDRVWVHEMNNDLVRADDGEVFVDEEAANRNDYYHCEDRGEYYYMDSLVYCDHTETWNHCDDAMLVVDTREGTYVALDNKFEGLCVTHGGELSIVDGVPITDVAASMSEQSFIALVNDCDELVSYLEFSDNLELDFDGEKHAIAS